MPVESFGSPLIKHAYQWPHRLIRFVVLLVFIPQLLADGGTRFSASRLLFRLDRLLVELFQVMIDDELVVYLLPFLFRIIDAAIVEVEAMLEVRNILGKSRKCCN